MAISFVGSKTFINATTSAQSCSLADLVDASGATATLQENDLVIVALDHATTSDRTEAQLIPTGFTAAHPDLYVNDSSDVNFLVSYKLMGATPDASMTVPAADSTARPIALTVHALRGVDTTTPLDVTPSTASAGNTGIVDPPSITPVTPGAWILVAGGVAVFASENPDALAHGGDLSNATNHFRQAISNPNQAALVGAGLKTDWVSGPFDPAVWGGSSTAATASWAAATLALRPAGGSPAPTGGKVKVWTGAAFAEKPVKVWNGSAWAEKPVKFWNGNGWTAS